MKATDIPHHILLSAFMASTPDQVYFKDLESRLVWVSDSLARSLGRAVEEIVGRTDADFSMRPGQTLIGTPNLRLREPGAPIIDCLIKHTWRSGRFTWSLNVAIPMRDEQGKIVSVWGTNRHRAIKVN